MRAYQCAKRHLNPHARFENSSFGRCAHCSSAGFLYDDFSLRHLPIILLLSAHISLLPLVARSNIVCCLPSTPAGLNLMGDPCAYRNRYVHTRSFGAFDIYVLVIYTILFGPRFKVHLRSACIRSVITWVCRRPSLEDSDWKNIGRGRGTASCCVTDDAHTGKTNVRRYGLNGEQRSSGTENVLCVAK